MKTTTVDIMTDDRFRIERRWFGVSVHVDGPHRSATVTVPFCRMGELMDLLREALKEWRP